MTQTIGYNEEPAAVQVLKERHSVRQFKKDHYIPEDMLRRILDAARHAPSAWNLQHWKFFIIQDAAAKEMLLPIANNQRQVLDSSLTVVILGDTEANKNAAVVYSQWAAEAGLPLEIAEKRVANIDKAYEALGEQFGRDHAYLNGALVALQLMLAAKAYGYDSVPMTGFNALHLSEAFLIEPRYIPIMLIPIGLSDEPNHQIAPKLPLDDLIYRIV